MNFMEKAKPIGVFDSGIGGLTVVRRIINALPKESIVYFGDTARVPYGSKSNETVTEYSLQNSKFLMSKGVKAIVVACNTASSVALPALRKEFTVPVVGMIDAGARLALRETKNKRIGVIGTRATINNKAYSNEILKHDPTVTVFEQACPLFVPLAEEGWMNHAATELIAQEYLAPLIQQDIDTLVLGCTHYPVLWEVIHKVMGDSVKLIDSGIAAAEVVRAELNRIGLETNSNAEGSFRCFVSDMPNKFEDVANLFFGKTISSTERVDVSEL